VTVAAILTVTTAKCFDSDAGCDIVVFCLVLDYVSEPLTCCVVGNCDCECESSLAFAGSLACQPTLFTVLASLVATLFVFFSSFRNERMVPPALRWQG
jgi:hypothetical protein